VLCRIGFLYCYLLYVVDRVRGTAHFSFELFVLGLFFIFELVMRSCYEFFVIEPLFCLVVMMMFK
jgi:hypothetical protein